MQRKQYIKPIANPKPLFFENLLTTLSPYGTVDHETTDPEGGGNAVGDQDARVRYDVDWFGTSKNSSFDF